MTSRIDIIGQNGNSGDHYDKIETEKDLEIEQIDVEPVSYIKGIRRGLLVAKVLASDSKDKLKINEAINVVSRQLKDMKNEQ